MTKTTSNKSIKENMSKRSVLKNMRNMNMVLEQLDCQERGARGASWLRSNWITGHTSKKTSQLETTALLGSTSKRSIMALIISQESMSKRNKNITNLEQEEHRPKV
jgi:hypothetical protein